jgi:hypothetical protein
MKRKRKFTIPRVKKEYKKAFFESVKEMPIWRKNMIKLMFTTGYRRPDPAYDPGETNHQRHIARRLAKPAAPSGSDQVR